MATSILEDVAQAFKAGISDGYRQAAREAEAAKKRTKEWGLELSGITRSLIGSGGLVYGLAQVTKELQEFAQAGVRLQNFATDTRFAVQQVLEFRQAGARMGQTIEETNKSIANTSNIFKDLQSRGTIGSALFADISKMGPKAVQLWDETRKKMVEEGPAAARKFLFGELSRQPPNVLHEWAVIIKERESIITGENKALAENVKIWGQATAEAEAMNNRLVSLITTLDNMRNVVGGDLTKVILGYADALGLAAVGEDSFRDASARFFQWFVANNQQSLATLKEMYDDISAVIKFVQELDASIGKTAAKLRTELKEQAVKALPSAGLAAGVEPEQKLGPAQPEHAVDKLLRESLEGAAKVLQELIGVKPAHGATEGGGVNPLARFDTSRFEMKSAIEEGTERGIVRGLEKVFGPAGGDMGMLGAGGGGFAFARTARTGMMRPGGLRRGGQRRAYSSGGGADVDIPQEGPSAPAGTYRPPHALSDADTSDDVVNTVAGEAQANKISIDAVINNMLNRVGTRAYGPSGNLQEVARAPGQYAGYREAGQKHAEFIRSRIRAIASGSEPDITGGSNEFRAAGYMGPWGQRHADSPVIGGNRFGFNPEGGRGPYGPYSADAVRRRGEADEERRRIDRAVNNNRVSLGYADINLHVRAPKGTTVDTKAGGIFENINTTRSPQNADAGAGSTGNYSHQSFE